MFHIARGLHEGQGPFALRFTSLQELRRCCAGTLGLHDGLPEDEALVQAERQLIAQLRPVWNLPGRKARR